MLHTKFLFRKPALKSPKTVLRVLTIGEVRLFWLLKAEVDVVLEKCFEFQLVFSKPSVFNYAQNEMTKQILLSVLLLKQPRFICVHVCVHVSGFSLTPIPQYFFIIRTENRDKLIKGETESTTLSVHPLAFIFHSFQFISILLAINSKVVPTTF